MGNDLSSPGAVERLTVRLAEVAGADVQLERPKDSAHGDFATNVALRAAKAAGRPPRDLAAELAAKLAELPEISAAEVAGPGFVNLRLADAFFIEALAEIGDCYGGGSAETPERVQVELVSANPTGPITVASARNGAYGDAVARLLAFAGHTVEREYYYNDAGAQMERFRLSVEAVRRGESGGRHRRRNQSGRLEPHLRTQRLVKFLLDAEFLKDGRVFRVQLHAWNHLRLEAAHELDNLGEFLFIVEPDSNVVIT